MRDAGASPRGFSHLLLKLYPRNQKKNPTMWQVSRRHTNQEGPATSRSSPGSNNCKKPAAAAVAIRGLQPLRSLLFAWGSFGFLSAEPDFSRLCPGRDQRVTQQKPSVNGLRYNLQQEHEWVRRKTKAFLPPGSH